MVLLIFKLFFQTGFLTNKISTNLIANYNIESPELKLFLYADLEEPKLVEMEAKWSL